MISTRNLSLLPHVNSLRRTMQAMAMLDAILCPEWQYRFYSFNTEWNSDQQMGSMRNGSGDELFAHFGPAGCWIKGFAHEAPMSPRRDDPSRVWPGVLDSVPSSFAPCLREAAFRVHNTTFCLWHRHDDHAWEMGRVELATDHPDPDGSAFLLSPLDGRPETYRAWAMDYHERPLSLEAVERVYRHEPLTPELVARINPELTLAELFLDASEIGYPGAARCLVST